MFTDTWEKKILDAIFGNTALSGVPATLYVGLLTAAPSDDGSGVSEPSGNGYARVAVTNNTTNWPAATGSGAGASSKTNGSTITFPQATGAWGTVTHFGIFDASTAGNLISYGALGASKSPVNLDTPSFAPGDITLQQQ